MNRAMLLRSSHPIFEFLLAALTAALGPIAAPLLRGVALGLGSAMPIGPINIEIARRTLRRGFASGALLGLGAVSVDVTYAVLSSVSLSALRHPLLARVLGWGGVALLTYLGASSLTAVVRHWRDDPLVSSAGSATPVAAYVTGVLMTMLNPMTLAFWFAVVPAMAGANNEEPARNLPMICAGVFLGTVMWVLLFAGVLHRAGKHGRRGWVAVADGVGGVLLLGFAAAGVWRMWSRPL